MHRRLATLFHVILSVACTSAPLAKQELPGCQFASRPRNQRDLTATGVPSQTYVLKNLKSAVEQFGGISQCAVDHFSARFVFCSSNVMLEPKNLARI